MDDIYKLGLTNLFIEIGLIEPQFFADSFFVKKPERVETIKSDTKKMISST